MVVGHRFLRPGLVAAAVVAVLHQALVDPLLLTGGTAEVPLFTKRRPVTVILALQRQVVLAAYPLPMQHQLSILGPAVMGVTWALQVLPAMTPKHIAADQEEMQVRQLSEMSTSPGSIPAPSSAPSHDQHDLRAPATAGFFMPEGGRHACAYP